MGPIICAGVACASVFVPLLVRFVLAAVSRKPKAEKFSAEPQETGT